MTIYVFSLLAVLFALMSWVVLRVTQNAKHRHQPIFDVNPKLQRIVCVVLFLCGIYWFYNVAHALEDGHIRVALSGRYSRHSSGYTIYRATNPRGFWEAICFETYGGLLMSYLPLAEIYLANRRKTRPEHRPRRLHESTNQ